MTSFSQRERQFAGGIDEVAIVRDLLDQNLVNLEQNLKIGGKRKGRTAYIDYYSTPWGIKLTETSINDPSFY